MGESSVSLVYYFSFSSLSYNYLIFSEYFNMAEILGIICGFYFNAQRKLLYLNVKAWSIKNAFLYLEMSDLALT